MRVIDWPEFTGETPVESGPASPLPPEDSPTEPGISITIGVFDGVHRGHRELIRRIVANSPVSTVVTFKQNPKQVIFPEACHRDIFSLRQKLAVLESLGVSQTVLIDFSEKFSKLSGREFIQLLKNRCRIVYAALGMNFRCGYRLDTGAEAVRSLMNEDGITTDLVHPVMEGRYPVSSSRIRTAVSAGDLSAAAVLLGRNVRIDVSDIPVCAAGEGRFYDAASVCRLLPPAGRYKALIYGTDGGAGIKTEISIKDGTILVPRTAETGILNAVGIEFICEAQKKPADFSCALNMYPRSVNIWH